MWRPTTSPTRTRTGCPRCCRPRGHRRPVRRPGRLRHRGRHCRAVLRHHVGVAREDLRTPRRGSGGRRPRRSARVLRPARPRHDGPGTGLRRPVRHHGADREAGFAVPVAGGARLAVVAHKGATTVPTMPSVAGFTTFRQVKWAGSSEGYTTIALGVRARLPHRVFTLYDASTNRSRLVVDVAHRCLTSPGRRADRGPSRVRDQGSETSGPVRSTRPVCPHLAGDPVAGGVRAHPVADEAGLDAGRPAPNHRVDRRGRAG